MLTHKQEQFCKCIVSGLGASESYMTAYDCKSTSAARIEATKLLKRDDITEYIQALKKPIINAFENSNINARQQQIDFILERIEICKEKQDEQSIIRYTDMLNKIYGTYKEDTNDQKNDNTLSNIDTSTLLKLSGAS